MGNVAVAASFEQVQRRQTSAHSWVAQTGIASMKN
jgi:hypothetical protein